MSEKYEDLLENIENDDTFDMTRSELVGARVALQWLDQNRDQAPGRTVTESELRVIAGRLFARWPDLGVFMGHLQRELTELGVTVIPNPTNAEKLELIWADWDPTREGVWEFFDRRGVKAPGGDDE